MSLRSPNSASVFQDETYYAVSYEWSIVALTEVALEETFNNISLTSNVINTDAHSLINDGQ